MHFKRHDLVYAPWGSDTIDGILHNEFRQLVEEGKIPGIVRRDESSRQLKHTTYYDDDETVYVGFVYPHKIDGARLRYASSVNGKCITKRISPFEVAKIDYAKRTLCLQVLEKITASYKVGVWGSAAMEIVTGLPYTGPTSDLDIMVKKYDAMELLGLWNTVSELEESHSVRIDVEVLLRNGYSINLKEYFMGEDTLLAKGLRDVILIEKDNIDEFYEACG